MLPTLCAINVRNLTPHQTYELFKFHGDQRTRLCKLYDIHFSGDTHNQRLQLFQIQDGIKKHLVLTGFYRAFEYEASIKNETVIGYTQDLIKILWNKLGVREFEEITEQMTVEPYVQTINMYLLKCGKNL